MRKAISRERMSDQTFGVKGSIVITDTQVDSSYWGKDDERFVITNNDSTAFNTISKFS